MISKIPFAITRELCGHWRHSFRDNIKYIHLLQVRVVVKTREVIFYLYIILWGMPQRSQYAKFETLGLMGSVAR